MANTSNPRIPLYALITGANGGIGQALCETFTEGGYRVIATDLHPEPVNGLVCAHYISADLAELVRSKQAADAFFAAVRKLCVDGQLQTLINNAAVQILGGVESLSRREWQLTLDVNLTAPFLLVQGLLPELEAAKGSIVNISSIHAKLTKRNFVAYATSKAALSGMTRAMAVDLGPRVRVNAIEPAAIETEMLIEGFNKIKQKYDELQRLHPVKRLGHPSEVAALAYYISSGKINFLHGECLSMSGGINNCLQDPD